MQTNHLGRSKFVADPYFNGQFASLRVYGRALSAAEIVAPLPRISRPIAGATWLLVYEQQKDATKGKKLVEFLKWALTKGESMAKDLDYAPLPDSLRDRVLKRVEEIKM